MSQLSATQATIQGDVSGQVAVGSYILQVGDIHGGIVHVAPPSEQLAYEERPYPVNFRPRAFPSLLDREGEFETAKTTLDRSAPLSLYGEAGIGKTSFLRQLAHLRETERFPHGVVYLAPSETRLEDLLQALFNAFFESSPEFKPTEAEVRFALQELQALILLDDLDLQNNEVISLLNSAPRCTFVLSSAERRLWGEGQPLQLEGLPEEDSLKLLERELGRPLNEEEAADARKTVGLLKGHPLQLLWAAALIRERHGSFRNLLGELQADTLETALRQAAMSETSDDQKRFLAILSAAGGNSLSLEQLTVIANNPNAQETLQGLISLGLVGPDGPRYKLTGNLASMLSTLWDLSAWEDALVRYFLRWLEKEAAPAAVEKSAEALIHTLKRAGEKKRWREVILLGRALERYFILWKRWQAWADLLDQILKAAKALVDRKTEAWSLHQMGSRAMCLEEKELARQLLSQALNIREAIKDKAGARVTEHNLKVLLHGSGTLNSRKPNIRRWVIGGLGAVLAVLLSATITIGVFSSEESPWRRLIRIPPIPLFVTDTPVSTNTFTPTPTTTLTHTPSPTVTSTISLTPTSSPTPTPTRTSTSTSTSTSTPSRTPTHTPSITITPVTITIPPGPFVITTFPLDPGDLIDPPPPPPDIR